jgi:hypothetical protein
LKYQWKIRALEKEGNENITRNLNNIKGRSLRRSYGKIKSKKKGKKKVRAKESKTMN